MPLFATVSVMLCWFTPILSYPISSNYECSIISRELSHCVSGGTALLCSTVPCWGEFKSWRSASTEPVSCCRARRGRGRFIRISERDGERERGRGKERERERERERVRGKEREGMREKALWRRERTGRTVQGPHTAPHRLYHAQWRQCTTDT